ncbi:hypothetical protein [Nocardioides coralli]|uniref:hypothetical protein n=1 Tax=Nocardioides coralli TaxID=2872154 RepID=UPI001CA3FCA2|nr:hypothetical protein [Nocardioides coralli]QZY29236.1 hypothetical protein K6T13_00460 [Nocardioides coralli]
MSTNNTTGPTGRFSNFGKLGGQLGVLLCVIGFVALFLGWNGAASKNVIMAQFPFLISGGMAGLAIVVIGGAMLVVQNAREDRARLEAKLDRLITAVEHSGGGGQAARRPASVADGSMVLAGPTSYHRLECSLPAARDEAHLLGLDDALARGIEPCRVCRPPAMAPPAYA